MTAARVEAWHAAHLLPRRRQGHTQGVRGSSGVYPPGTERQLLALCRLRAQRRKHAELAFLLFWEGYPVALEVVKRAWHRLMPWPHDGRDLRSAGVAILRPQAAAEAAIDCFGPGPRHPVTRWLVRRLPDDDERRRALMLVLIPGYGGYPPLGSEVTEPGETSDSDLLRGLLGMDAPKPPVGPKWVFEHQRAPAFWWGQAVEELQTAGFEGYASLHGAVDHADLAALVTAVRDARLWLVDLPAMLRSAAQAKGDPNADLFCLAFGDLLPLTTQASQDASSYAALSACWLLARPAFGNQAVDQLHGIVAIQRAPSSGVER